MPNALLIYPEYPPSYWGMHFALEISGFKAAFPPLGLLTIAAMFPAGIRSARRGYERDSLWRTRTWSGPIWSVPPP